MRKLRNKKTGKVLAGYIKTSLISGLLVAGYSLILYIFEKYRGVGSNWMLIAFVVLVVFFILSSYRIIHILLNILTSF